jgi:signal transduction histidine kinase
MLMQVVDNAWKYSAPGARIFVKAAQALSTVGVRIQNEGSGIREEERERIFGKFYRGTATRAIEGTGLGLAIARAIAEAHGGAVWLDSEPEGPAFRFSLPIEGATPLVKSEENTGKTSDREPNYISH